MNPFVQRVRARLNKLRSSLIAFFKMAAHDLGNMSNLEKEGFILFLVVMVFLFGCMALMIFLSSAFNAAVMASPAEQKFVLRFFIAIAVLIVTWYVVKSRNAFTSLAKILAWTVFAFGMTLFLPQVLPSLNSEQFLNWEQAPPLITTFKAHDPTGIAFILGSLATGVVLETLQGIRRFR